MTEPTHAALVAADLLARGWSPLPLPTRAKTEPPRGFTGYSGRYATAADVAGWAWNGNVAIRLPPDVVGIDVDVYHDGDAGFAELTARFGALPPTVWSTSREDGSGIALFRVPTGTTLQTDPAVGVDMIQAHHRYMVVWPSIHPEGRIYQWIDEQSYEQLEAPPAVDELPDLPWAWIEGLTVTKSPTEAAATPQEVRRFVDANTAASRPGALKGIQTKLDNRVGGRHDTLVQVACWAMREALAGYYSADEAIAVLQRWWTSAMDDPKRLEGGEFGSAIMWAVAQANADPTRIQELKDARGPAAPSSVDPTTGEVIPDARNLPAEFWGARPAFEHIQRAAHSRSLSADAVLGAVLARVALLTPPSLTLPAIAGRRGSLNLCVGLVGPSGSGKTAAIDVAEELLPTERQDLIVNPLGSGEGLIEQFYETVIEEIDGKKKAVKKQTRTGALSVADEGQAIASMAGRSGSTLMENIRSAWAGARVGQANATQETFRRLEPHRYRWSLVAGFQPEFAHGLIADAAGGTPQRFVFLAATDPALEAPETPPEWPGELDFTPPPSYSLGHSMSVAPTITEAVVKRRRMIQAGKYEVDPLDAHADLVRLKVAGLLAVLDGRSDVAEDDWDLAQRIWRTSCVVRGWVIAVHRADEAAKQRARTERRVSEETAVATSAEERAVAKGARSIARRVQQLWGQRQVVPISRRELHHAVASRDRQLASLDEMLAYALDQKWIEPVDDGWKTGESRPA